MDCTLWPIVNFIGFSVVPMKLQPTYMSAVSLIWQIYVSSVASAHENHSDTDLRKLFDDIDTNKV